MPAGEAGRRFRRPGIRLDDLEAEERDARRALAVGGRLPRGACVGTGLPRLGLGKRWGRAEPDCDTGQGQQPAESGGSLHVFYYHE